MITTIIVILRGDSVSFCYYDDKDKGPARGEWISEERLSEVVGYAGDNSLLINFLHCNEELPQNLKAIIDGIPHIDIMPLNLLGKNNEGIAVINECDIDQICNIEESSENNLILRLPKSRLGELARIFESLIGKFKRLNITLLGIDLYKDEDLEEYGNQLGIIRDILIGEYEEGNSPEVNILSDRIILDKMNNCNAGFLHVTYAPNGHFYICPGFYYDDPENSIGSVAEGIKIKNEQLLRIDHAPICLNCDAYQCRRCVWLNRKTTLEINIPSHEQCVLSHLERNAAKSMLDYLKKSNFNFKDYQDIEPLNNLDPFELVNRKDKLFNFNGVLKKDMKNDIRENEIRKLSERNLLLEIYRMQKEILQYLKK
jgi:CXXX repeat peptide maturase